MDCRCYGNDLLNRYFDISHKGSTRKFWIANDTDKGILYTVIWYEIRSKGKERQVTIESDVYIPRGRIGFPTMESIDIPADAMVQGVLIADDSRNWYQMLLPRMERINRLNVSQIMLSPCGEDVYDNIRNGIYPKPIGRGSDRSSSSRPLGPADGVAIPKRTFLIKNNTPVNMTRIVLTISAPSYYRPDGTRHSGSSMQLTTQIIDQAIVSPGVDGMGETLASVEIPEHSAVMAIAMMDGDGRWYDLPVRQLRFGMGDIQVSDILPYPRDPRGSFGRAGIINY